MCVCVGARLNIRNDWKGNSKGLWSESSHIISFWFGSGFSWVLNVNYDIRKPVQLWRTDSDRSKTLPWMVIGRSLDHDQWLQMVTLPQPESCFIAKSESSQQLNRVLNDGSSSLKYFMYLVYSHVNHTTPFWLRKIGSNALAQSLTPHYLLVLFGQMTHFGGNVFDKIRLTIAPKL